MSNVLLIDVDKVADKKLKIPNLALMQISAWHKQGRHDVVGIVKEPVDTGKLMILDIDKAYLSCIFTKNRPLAEDLIATLMKHRKGIQISAGGTGIGNIPDWLPPEMQKIKPDYALYPSTYSQGYTTRGCIRTCGFCVVPQKEGIIKPWQKPNAFHDERFDTCMIMDNNLFGAPLSWQDSVFSWFSKNEVKMMSPQGWDARLLNQHRCEMLASVRHFDGRLHFAWDNMEDESAVRTAIGLLEKNGFNLRRNVSFYVLCGYNTTFEQDLYRCVKLKDMGVRAYAMRYRQTPALNALARWTALPQLFWKIDFEEYTRDKKKWEKKGVSSDGSH